MRNHVTQPSVRLLVPPCYVFLKAVEWDLWQVYVSSSLGAAFNYACVALYFESAVLTAHPVSEVCMTGMDTYTVTYSNIVTGDSRWLPVHRLLLRLRRLPPHILRPHRRLHLDELRPHRRRRNRHPALPPFWEANGLRTGIQVS